MVYYNTQNHMVKIREASMEDIPLILSFIIETAEYEKMGTEVFATEESLTYALFNNNNDNKPKVIIAEFNGQPVGYALYFYNFSTFTGKPGLYLEDIFVKDHLRGIGIGKLLFLHLVKIAKEKGCPTMDWACLNWNTPSINFYKALGAVPLNQWTLFRLHEKEMNNLCEPANKDI